jgi:ferredoxin-NADP reductase
VIMGPGGRLTLSPDADRVCFLVGGVGITPVRCILRDAAYRGRWFDDALLVYGNRDDTCVPFAEEFARMADRGVRLELCYEHPPAGWGGASGFITAKIVSALLPDFEGVEFFVAGPPVMVSVMERVLDDLQVPEKQRHIERFGPPVHHRPDGPAAGSSL